MENKSDSGPNDIPLWHCCLSAGSDSIRTRINEAGRGRSVGLESGARGAELQPRVSGCPGVLGGPRPRPRPRDPPRLARRATPTRRKLEGVRPRARSWGPAGPGAELLAGPRRRPWNFGEGSGRTVTGPEGAGRSRGLLSSFLAGSTILGLFIPACETGNSGVCPFLLWLR